MPRAKKYDLSMILLTSLSSLLPSFSVMILIFTINIFYYCWLFDSALRQQNKTVLLPKWMLLNLKYINLALRPSPLKIYAHFIEKKKTMQIVYEENI